MKILFNHSETVSNVGGNQFYAYSDLIKGNTLLREGDSLEFEYFIYAIGDSYDLTLEYVSNGTTNVLYYTPGNMYNIRLRGSIIKSADANTTKIQLWFWNATLATFGAEMCFYQELNIDHTLNNVIRLNLQDVAVTPVDDVIAVKYGRVYFQNADDIR